MVSVPLKSSSYSVAVVMISPQHEQGLAMLGPAHSLTGSSRGSRPDVSNPRTRSRTCASSKTFPPELLSTPPKAGTGIGSPSVGEACRVVKTTSPTGKGRKDRGFSGGAQGGRPAAACQDVRRSTDGLVVVRTGVGGCLKDWTLTDASARAQRWGMY